MENAPLQHVLDCPIASVENINCLLSEPGFDPNFTGANKEPPLFSALFVENAGPADDDTQTTESIAYQLIQRAAGQYDILNYESEADATPIANCVSF